MPESIAGQIKTCAIKHNRHLPAENHTVTFEVELDNNRQVDSITLVDSDLGDEELEACMASSIRSLTEEDLPLRSAENADRELSKPQSRMLLGNPGVGHPGVLGNPAVLAACLASPPCLLSMVVLMGATVITVQIMVHAASTTAPPIATHTAPPIATPTATTTAVPTATATTTTTSPPIAVPRRCLPCLPVPVGEHGYDYHSVADGNDSHNGMADHTHHFRMNQSPPVAGCRCFWKRNFIPPTDGFSPLPGAVLVISTPGGGGIAP
jgi:hypothetical protein